MKSSSDLAKECLNRVAGRRATSATLVQAAQAYALLAIVEELEALNRKRTT